MAYLHQVLDFFLHLDKHLDLLLQNYGSWSYGILFLIVFCETGLVITPFLPGDSLLFATGALAGRGSLDVNLIAVLLGLAAILGDAANYAIGYFAGDKLIRSGLVKKAHLDRTHSFYEKYGGKTIIFARFVPIVRTFAPFLAGMGKMNYARFATYNIVGGITWVVLFIYAGFFFGELDFVRKNFSLVILMIIILSILPAVYEIWKSRREAVEIGAD